MKSYLPRFFVISLFLGASSVCWAQFPPPESSSRPGAVQLPLSGRSAQGGSVNAAQTPTPGVTNSVNTLNTTVSIQGAFSGSTDSTAALPFSGTLSLQEAVQRGIKYNLGATGLANAVRQSHGQERVARSALLPNLNGSLRENVQQTNLRALGVRVNAPGFRIPDVAGPFNYFDLRATLTQTVADLTSWNNYRAARETARANEHTALDARDLIVLAVGGAYLQAQVARARLVSSRAQLDTAKATYNQTLQRRQAGLLPQIDVNRSLFQQQAEQQRLATLENDYAKQKINLARLTGLPPNPNYDLAGEFGYSPNPPVTLEEALRQAVTSREDLKAAQIQVAAAERARDAARAGRLPSLAFSADYGAIGTNPSQSHGTFTVVGTLRLPIWQGGRVEGEIEQASAVVDQRRAELQDIRSRIESEIRDAFLDLEAAASQVEVSQSNQKVTRETLDLTRQKFDAGITDSVEVIQAQESIASADLDHITSLFAHNLAKLTLARAIGHAEDRVLEFLNTK